METSFTRGDLSISLIDVGGQRSERKKWMHMMDNVNAVLYMVAMSEYDQTLREDAATNRMHESIRLFSTVCNNPWFKNAVMLLFLNKKDVFDEKIKYCPLEKVFPEYEGGQDKYEAESFISKMFVKEANLEGGVYRHFTCAKDSQNISVVFDCVIDVINQRNYKDCRMY